MFIPPLLSRLLDLFSLKSLIASISNSFTSYFLLFILFIEHICSFLCSVPYFHILFASKYRTIELNIDLASSSWWQPCYSDSHRHDSRVTLAPHHLDGDDEVVLADQRANCRANVHPNGMTSRGTTGSHSWWERGHQEFIKEMDNSFSYKTHTGFWMQDPCSRRPCY